MTDEAQPSVQPASKKDTPTPGGAPGKTGARGGGRRSSTPRAGSAQGQASGKGSRPASRSSNKKDDSSQPKHTPSNEERKNGRGGKRGGGNNKGRQPSTPKDVQAPTAKPDERSSKDVEKIQQLISEMSEMRGEARNKAPSNGVSPESATAPASTLAAQSNLPPNAPVFQPGAPSYPGFKAPEPAPRHRKAASVGANPAPPMNFSSSYSPNLGSMTEDSEDRGSGFEEGEISDTANFQPGHQARSQSQSFTAPRFAALARQEQSEVIGPSGRPQLAPSFTFGTRRRGANPPVIGPAISEEDVNFQFPLTYSD